MYLHTGKVSNFIFHKALFWWMYLGKMKKRYMRIWDPENMVSMSKNIQYDSIETTRMYSRITEEPVKGKLEKEGIK